MKKLVSVFVAAVIAFGSHSALAVEYTKGTVKKIDMKNKKVTIIHEELKNLDMPPMTMVFYPKDEAMLDSMTEGQAIEFVADRVDGRLMVIELK